LRVKLRNLRTRSSFFEIRPRTAILLILLVIFLISLTIYITSNLHKAGRIFFFPDYQSGKIIGEARRIPRIPFDRERNMEIFVKELLLGPMSMSFAPVFSTGNKLEKILYRNKIVYLDLNFMTLLPDKKAVQDFRDSILLLEKNIKFNFPHVRELVITVLGQKPEFDLTNIFLE